MFFKNIIRVAVGVTASLSIISGIARATPILPPSLQEFQAGLSAVPKLPQPFDGTYWNNPRTSYPAGWSHRTFTSAALQGRTVGYTLYLPPNYATQPNARFPVVYMLHGIGGNENVWAGMLNPSCCIIVGVNGGKKGRYLDAVPGSPPSGYKSESEVLELVSHVDATYRTQADAGGRALQGFSMGGFGTFHLGFEHPEMWSSIYTFSSAIHLTVADLPIKEPAFLAAMLAGNANLFEPDRPQTLAVDNLAAILASGMGIKGAVGQRDAFRNVNIAMYNELDALGIPNDGLTIIPGIGHDKSYVPSLDPIGWAMQYFTDGAALNAAVQDTAAGQKPVAAAAAAVPEPPSFALFGMGLMALVGMRLLRSKPIRVRTR